MNDLSKYVEMYRMTTEHDTEVLWSKVAIIREAIADGADVETLLSECGKESGDSPDKVKKFYAVAMIFDTKAIAQNYSYWLYEACVTDPRINIEDISTYHHAYEWFDKIEQREIKRGKKTIHAMHTPRTLRAAIRKQTASRKPKAETVWNDEISVDHVDFKNQMVTLVICNLTNSQLIQFADALNNGETVTAKITSQPETENAADAEGSKVA